MKFIPPSQGKLSHALETVQKIKAQIKHEIKLESTSMEYNGFIVLWTKKSDGNLLKYYVNPRVEIPGNFMINRYNPDAFDLPCFLLWLQTIDANDRSFVAFN
jgi:hypothetical protein